MEGLSLKEPCGQQIMFQVHASKKEVFVWTDNQRF